MVRILGGKDIPTFEKVYENYTYKTISLFVIKHLDANRNPISLYQFIKDCHNIRSCLRYFPFASLARADLSNADLFVTDLTVADLTSADILVPVSLIPPSLMPTLLVPTSRVQAHLDIKYTSKDYMLE